MTADEYVQSVIDFVPYGLPLREQIAMDLRSHIAERLAEGRTLEEAVRLLGDPLTLAESYLSAVPRASAPIGRRIAAKLIDVFTVAAFAVACSLVAYRLLPPPFVYYVPVMCLGGGVLAFVIYTAIAEYRWSGTVGKRTLGIQVVRESGARISLGQSLLRQLPFFGQFYFIDAAFALFTERHQRAFELLTKTRAVVVLLCFTLLSRP